MTKYKKTGKCIWCGKEEPNVSFNTAPHILPHALGGQEVGFDVCDKCNHDFGTAPKGKYGVPSVDHAFKEIFGAIRFFTGNLNSESYKHFKSQVFSYYHKARKVKINNRFNSKAYTRQFKRGLYEVFLQKYHQVTCDANNPKFDVVRDFALKDLGNPHVYYAFNNVILAPDKEYMDHPSLIMSEKIINDMNTFGYFHFWIMGHSFYLKVFPTLTNVYGHIYLQNEANTFLINSKGNESIYEFDDISQIDFFMQRFNS